MGWFWGGSWVRQLFWGLLMSLNNFSLFLSILTFDFDLILRSFLTFWGSNGLFLCQLWGSKTVLGSTHVVEQLSITMIP